MSFWTWNSPTSMVSINSTFIGKTQNYLHRGPLKLQKAINEIKSMVIPIVQEEYHQTLTKKYLWLRNCVFRFINNVVNDYQKGKECGDKSFVILPTLFEIAKSFILVEIPYCKLNAVISKHFLQKFHKFTNNSFRIVIMWKTINIWSLFPFKK